MKLGDVPAGCRVVRCQACGDYLAIPDEGTSLEVAARAAQAQLDHRQLCPGPPEPTPRQRLAALVADPTWCPETQQHHCGHWKAGATCCNCEEDHPT